MLLHTALVSHSFASGLAHSSISASKHKDWITLGDNTYIPTTTFTFLVNQINVDEMMKYKEDDALKDKYLPVQFLPSP